MEQTTTNIPKSLNASLVLLMPTKHMGNLLVSLQSIATLAQANKGQSLAIIDDAYREIIESIPVISEVLYYPRGRLRKANWLEKLALAKTFYSALQAHKAELLLNFDARDISTTIALISGVKNRRGLSDTPCKGLYRQIIDGNTTRSHRFYHYDQHAYQLLGEQSPSQYPALEVVDKHQQTLNKILQRHKIVPNQPYVCIHAGATKDYKTWPGENYSRTADWLAAQGYQVIFIGAGTSDQQIIEEISQNCQQTHMSLCNTLSLGQLIALFSQATLFLGNDSGPMHLATACAVPVVALFGPTDEKRWGPLGANANIVRDPVSCAELCSKKSCTENFRCIKLLGEDIVRGALAKHL